MRYSGRPKMQALPLIVSPSGRLSPRPFIVAAAAVYVLGVVSQWLTLPEVLDRIGLWAFVAVQVLLVWAWYTLHAKRLHDAGRSAGPAAGVALLYALAVALLIIVAASFFNTATAQTPDANSASTLGLILLVMVLATLSGAPQGDLAYVMVAVLTALALVPPIVAVAFTVWAARLPAQTDKP
jgi:uncharacterized membrane protein YhaH (DUF805 family)